MQTRTATIGWILVAALGWACAHGQQASKDQAPSVTNPVVVRDVVYGRGGETELKLDLYLPGKRNGAAIVVIHGGGWSSGDKRNFAEPALRYAKQGYVTVSINYRLSGVARFPAAVEDCKCAVRWLRSNAANLGVDPDRIGALGHSAGGHLALMLGLVKPDSGMEGAGCHDKVESSVSCVVSQAAPTQFVPSWRHPAVKGFLGGFADQVPQLAKKASPTTYVNRAAPPILMLHGTGDRAVPHTQVLALERALGRAGATIYQRISVRGGGHLLFEGKARDQQEQVLKRQDRFFARHLWVRPVHSR